MKESYGKLTINIAGLKLLLESNNPVVLNDLFNRYKAFDCNEESQLSIRIIVKDWDIKKSKLRLEPVFHDGRLYFPFPDYEGEIDLGRGVAEIAVPRSSAVEDADYFIRVTTSLLVFRAGGILLHGAGIIRNGKACIFLGHSGSGKTTVARLSPNDQVLNDDLVVIMPHQFQEGCNLGWTVYGTPFWNPDQVTPSQGEAQLYGMYLLEKDRRVYLDRLERGYAVAEIVSNVPVITLEPEANLRLLERVSLLVEVIPVYQLHFLPDGSFWQTIEKVS